MAKAPVDTPPASWPEPRAAAGQERMARILERLAAAPPQCLLLEGGSVDQRLGLLSWWAARLNCQGPEPRPCLACASCRQILASAHRDVFFLSGASESIKIDQVRALRALTGEPPRGGGSRVFLLAEAQGLEPGAANSLLKVLEEPRPGNVFALSAPQRERLLPTIVSRSFVLTLAWPGPGTPPSPPEADRADPAQIADALVAFLTSGQGWHSLTSGRGAVDRRLAEETLVELQRRLVAALRGEAGLPSHDPVWLRRLDLAVDQAREALQYKVNPALVLDWLAVTARTWLDD